MTSTRNSPRSWAVLAAAALGACASTSTDADLAGRIAACARFADQLDQRQRTLEANAGNSPTSSHALWPAPVPLTQPDGQSTALAYPDGSWLPALNGVVNPPAVRWPESRPFSKVIGKRVDAQGSEWYVHEDGSESTSVLEWREDLGRRDAVVRVKNPSDLVP